MDLDLTRIIAPFAAAIDAIARLDTALGTDLQRQRFLTISRLHEAVRSARMDLGPDVDVEKLLCVLHDPLDSYQPTAVRAAVGIHRALVRLALADPSGWEYSADELARVAALATCDELAIDLDSAAPDIQPLDPEPISRWLASIDQTRHPLFQAADAFTWWHRTMPYGDQSPRVARVLLPLAFQCAGLINHSGLMITAGLPVAYRRQFVPPNNNTDAVVGFCLAVSKSARLGLRRARHLQTLSTRYANRFSDRRSNSRIPAALDLLFHEPFQDLRSLQRKLDLSPRGSLLLVQQLTAAGVLTEVTDRERFRLYVAWDIAHL